MASLFTVVEPTGTIAESAFLSLLHTPRTTGPYLAIIPSAAHGAHVNLGGKHLDLTGHEKLLLGTDFLDGQLILRDDQHLWYPDFTWPDYSVITSDFDVPRMTYVSGQRCGIHGADYHDGNGTPMSPTFGASDYVIEGVDVLNVYEHPNTDPNDYSHQDSVAMLHGGNTNGLVRYCYFQDHSRMNTQAFDGDILNLVHDHVWMNSGVVASIFNARNGHKITGKRTNCVSWGHTPERVDYVDLKSIVPNSSPRIQISGVVGTSAPTGTTPPALWRASHPYSSWRTYFAGLPVV